MHRSRRAGAAATYGNVNLFPVNVAVMAVVMVSSHDTVSSLVQTMSKGVVVA